MKTINEIQKKADRIQAEKRQEYHRLTQTWIDFAEKAILLCPERVDAIYTMWDEIEGITDNELLKERIGYAINCVKLNLEWEEMEEKAEQKTKEDYILWNAGQ